MHVIDKKGNIKIGVEAFMTIWDELNYWRLLSLLIRVKPIKFIVDLCYNFWAKRRYNRLDYKCDVKKINWNAIKIFKFFILQNILSN